MNTVVSENVIRRNRNTCTYNEENHYHILKYFTTYYINRIKLLRIISTISDYSSMGQRDDGVKIDTVEP